MVLQLITVWNAQLKLSNQSWLMESRSRPGRQLWMPWEIFKPECVQTVSVSTDVCKATLGFAYGDYLSCLDRGADRSPFSKLIRTWVWVITVLPWPVLPVQVRCVLPWVSAEREACRRGRHVSSGTRRAARSSPPVPVARWSGTDELAEAWLHGFVFSISARCQAEPWGLLLFCFFSCFFSNWTVSWEDQGSRIS